MVLTVVTHDGGVRLICAGWIPQDDGSDVNGTAVYSRASLLIAIRIILWLIGSLQVGSRTAPTDDRSGQLSVRRCGATAWWPATSPSRPVHGRWRRWPRADSFLAR